MMERYRVNPRAIVKEGESRLVKVEGKRGVYKIVNGSDSEVNVEKKIQQGVNDEFRTDLVEGIVRILDDREEVETEGKEESESKLGKVE